LIGPKASCCGRSAPTSGVLGARGNAGAGCMRRAVAHRKGTGGSGDKGLLHTHGDASWWHAGRVLLEWHGVKDVWRSGALRASLGAEKPAIGSTAAPPRAQGRCARAGHVAPAPAGCPTGAWTYEGADVLPAKWALARSGKAQRGRCDGRSHRFHSAIGAPHGGGRGLGHGAGAWLPGRCCSAGPSFCPQLPCCCRARRLLAVAGVHRLGVGRARQGYWYVAVALCRDVAPPPIGRGGTPCGTVSARGATGQGALPLKGVRPERVRNGGQGAREGPTGRGRTGHGRPRGRG
jgi:hypothetical protein